MGAVGTCPCCHYEAVAKEGDTHGDGPKEVLVPRDKEEEVPQDLILAPLDLDPHKAALERQVSEQGGIRGESMPLGIGKHSSVAIGYTMSLNSAEKYGLEPLRIADKVLQMYNVNLHVGNDTQNSLRSYYCLCKDAKHLHVTTACFTAWKKSKKSNGDAKVIPALKVGCAIDEPVRIFFFDDNLEFEGLEKSPGICNLRDVLTGEFVDFTDKTNGFEKKQAGKHTVVHSSTQYRNVLVKVNILDAMEDLEFFWKILKTYTQPGEKVLIFMDVNSTIICNDSVQGKDTAASLLGTMFECVQFKPQKPMDFEWEPFPKMKLEKTKTLKAMIKEMIADMGKAYGGFWNKEQCFKLVGSLLDKGDLTWVGTDAAVTMDNFRTSFEEYLVVVENACDSQGICNSWYRLYAELTAGRLFPGDNGKHSIFLNSFGVDTMKVVNLTIPDPTRVIQITVNFELWDERDKDKFKSQFTEMTKSK